MTVTLRSGMEFECTCHEKSIKLMEKAISENRLNSGRSHVWTSIKGIFCEPTSVITRTLHIAGNIFMICFTPFVKNMTHTKEILIYRACRLVLDPLNVLIAVATTVTRIASSILGIYSPLVAAKGWILAEKADLWSANLKAKLWNKLMPEVADENELDLYKIEPGNAVTYLGKPLCLELEGSRQDEAEKAQVEQEIRDGFAELLTHLANNEVASFTNTFREKSGYSHIDTIIEKTTANATEYMQIIENAKTLKIEEVRKLRNYIYVKSHSNVNWKDFKRLNLPLSKNLELFSCYEEFGGAKYPIHIGILS